MSDARDNRAGRDGETTRRAVWLAKLAGWLAACLLAGWLLAGWLAGCWLATACWLVKHLLHVRGVLRLRRLRRFRLRRLRRGLFSSQMRLLRLLLRLLLVVE